MNIDEYFHKTLFASTIIIGPALAMTLPFVYWVQYRDMLFFPSFLYYVTGTGCISAMLYFGLYVMPDSLKRLKEKKMKIRFAEEKDKLHAVRSLQRNQTFYNTTK